jgi:hypothetical protein
MCSRKSIWIRRIHFSVLFFILKFECLEYRRNFSFEICINLDSVRTFSRHYICSHITARTLHIPRPKKCTISAMQSLTLVAQTRLITFGQPRVGDFTYSCNHNRLVPYSYRVVHRADIVPHLPLCKKSNGICEQSVGVWVTYSDRYAHKSL